MAQTDRAGGRTAAAARFVRVIALTSGAGAILFDKAQRIGGTMDGEFYDEYGDEGEYGEEEAGWSLSPQDQRVAEIVEGVLEGREHGAAQHDEQLSAYSQRLEQEMPELLDPGIASEVHRTAQALAFADGHPPESAPAFWRSAAIALGVGRENGPRPTSPEARADAIVQPDHVGRRALPF